MTDLKNDVINISRDCHLYKINKPNLINYSYLPAKNIEHEHPSHTFCIDLIRLYTVTNTTRTVFTLYTMTMIDSSIGWFEIVEISNKTAKYMG